MTTETVHTSRPRYMISSSPRTASNLLVRILNLEGQGAHPVRFNGYFWLSSLAQRRAVLEKPMSKWTVEDKEKLDEVEQQCFDNLLSYLDGAEKEGELALFKEHTFLLNHPFYESELAHGKGTTIGEPMVLKNDSPGSRSPLNKTVLSDEMLKSFKPLFLIRHPALSLASMYRAARSDTFQRETKEPSVTERSSIWIRSLFDFYEANQLGETPLILDADDMMTSPELVRKYVKLAGLNPDKLRFSWEKASPEVISKQSIIAQKMLSSLNASDKVNLDKVGGDLDIDVEAQKWRAEFGDVDAAKLENWVRAAMPDYEYMRSKRVTL
ncbi:hypothetical protein HG530_000492 [Fusarium avenaceum]|nr:hypothetical protein HG530_000492 [Fusarium avenaceum]